MKKIFLAVIVCAAVSSCAFMGINGSYIPAGTYVQSDTETMLTRVILAEGRFTYERIHYGERDIWYEATFDTLTDIGHNGYEAVLTSLKGQAGATDWTKLNTSIAQLQLYYNNPILTIYFDVDGDGSFNHRIMDFNGVSFEKK